MADVGSESPENRIKSEEKEEDSSKNTVKSALSYDDFVNCIPHPDYFGIGAHQNFVDLAPELRKFFLKKLADRPLSREEFCKVLEQEAPHLNSVLDYLYDQVDNGGDYEADCRQILKEVTAGIEARVGSGTVYFGLTRKLDEASNGG